tara:strand:- start:12010 stop:13017 length:1008 start_codon:yes stop_codon:yes gene_type:complete
MILPTWNGNEDICIVLGVNGQDGSYAAECLLAKGYKVVGIGRQGQSTWIDKQPNYHYGTIDLLKFDDLYSVLVAIEPILIFNAAAVHGSNNFLYENVWTDAHAVNTYLTHGILEYIRNSSANCSYLYLSSSKAFGSEYPRVVDEQTPVVGTCIYSITKNASTDLISYYRTKHHVHATVVWTFNHESPRRTGSYFVSKVVDILAKSIEDSDYVGDIYTLDFWCDWGDAEEFMKICVDLAFGDDGGGFVLATGETLWARDFVEKLFITYGLKYSDHINEIGPQKIKSEPWVADVSLLRKKLGAGPSNDIFQVCKKILEENYPSVITEFDENTTNKLC